MGSGPALPWSSLPHLRELREIENFPSFSRINDMKKFLGAVALAIAMPSIALAQAAPAPPKMACCDKMKEKCACCKDMAGKGDEGHDMSGGKDPHAGHDMTPKASSPQSSN